jgi:hypothetical protein
MPNPLPFCIDPLYLENDFRQKPIISKELLDTAYGPPDDFTESPSSSGKSSRCSKKPFRPSFTRKQNGSEKVHSSFRHSLRNESLFTSEIIGKDVRQYRRQAYKNIAECILDPNQVHHSVPTKTRSSSFDGYAETKHIVVGSKIIGPGGEAHIGPKEQEYGDIPKYLRFEETLIEPESKKQRSKVAYGNRFYERQQFQPDAHKIVAMLTIVARQNTKNLRANYGFNVAPSQFVKRHLWNRINLFYKVASELSAGVPFHKIDLDRRLKFVAFYEDKKTRDGIVSPTRPHFHVLIYGEAPSLFEPTSLGRILERLSNTNSSDGKAPMFIAPGLNIEFPAGVTEEVLTSQRKMTNYCTKYLTEESVLTNEDFNETLQLCLPNFVDMDRLTASWSFSYEDETSKRMEEAGRKISEEKPWQKKVRERNAAWEIVDAQEQLKCSFLNELKLNRRNDEMLLDEIRGRIRKC